MLLDGGLFCSAFVQLNLAVVVVAANAAAVAAAVYAVFWGQLLPAWQV